MPKKSQSPLKLLKNLPLKPVLNRSEGVGGSDIAAIVGLSRFRTPLDVFLSKRGFAQPYPETPYQFWGKALEEQIAVAYSSETGIQILRGVGTLRRKDRPTWMIASPDAIWNPETSLTEGGAEFKNTSEREGRRWGEPGSDEIPDEYLVQCQWYMGFFGYDVWDCAVLIGGNDFRTYTIQHTPALYELLVERAGRFWRDNVMNDEPPPPQNEYDLDELLRIRFPRETEEDREGTAEEYSLVVAYDDARTKEKLSASLKESIGLQLKQKIGESSGIVVEKGRATWTRSRDKTQTDWESLARFVYELHNQGSVVPKDLLARFTLEKPGVRSLRVYLQKEKVYDGD